MAVVQTLAVYDLQPKVRDQLKHIVDSKQALGKDELKKRLAILDTRLCMAPCTLIMNDFQHHKTRGEVWLSEPFYSGPRGYKLCLCVYANGCGAARGSHVSAGVYMMWGENDDMLQWPASGTVKIEVQSNTWGYSSATEVVQLKWFVSPVTSGEKSKNAYGETRLLNHYNLSSYTNDNKMAFKVTVGP